jgi:hypothetical protein
MPMPPNGCLGEDIFQQRGFTLRFNGNEEVAGLYAGMDLSRYY